MIAAFSSRTTVDDCAGKHEQQGNDEPHGRGDERDAARGVRIFGGHCKLQNAEVGAPVACRENQAGGQSDE
jgi:hypothetical protein